MKRRLIILLLALAALLLAAPIVAYAAEDYSFATLRYATEDGGEGILAKDAEFGCGLTVTCDASVATMKLDDKPVEGNSVSLTDAGRYRLVVQKRDGNEQFIYTVTILPRINIADGQVFTSFPVIECENVSKIVLDGRYSEPIASGTVVDTFGAHVLEVTGINNYTFKFYFYVRACDAVFTFDEGVGQYGLRVTVGAFEGVEVTLDGTQVLAPGSYFITAVGQHSVSATLNGEPLVSKAALPSADEMNIQVRLILPETTSREPFSLQLSRWNADFYLDGERVEGLVRIDKHGTHELEVRNADGTVMSKAFLIRATAEEQGRSETTLSLTFDNPHRVYVVFLIVPAVALLAVAACFLVLRRRIV